MDGWTLLGAIAQHGNGAMVSLLFGFVALAINPRIFGIVSALIVALHIVTH